MSLMLLPLLPLPAWCDEAQAAITADATDKTLNLLFTPLNVVQQKAVAVQGVLAAGGAKAGQVMAGLVKIGTGAKLPLAVACRRVLGVHRRCSGSISRPASRSWLV